jgi:hypothetical protein
MSAADPTGSDWSQREIDLIVADYFAMLGMELRGETFVKAHRNAALQELTGRSHGSIEFKHQNISAVLLRLGLPWIAGYKPMANYQKALMDGIERLLDARHEALAIGVEPAAPGLAYEPALFFEPPPVLAAAEPAEPAALKRLVRKFDPAGRDARNRALGERGEERVFFSEHARLAAAGRADLARRVRWVAREDGDGAGYDILSFSAAGDERLLEVKTTTGHQTTPFYLTENERLLSVERPDEFRLVRLYDFARFPKAFRLAPPLEESVMLRPASYRATFGG